MIRWRVLKQIEAVRIVLGADRNSSHLVGRTVTVAAALKPLKEMTNALSAEKCPTISAVKPLLSHITTVVLADSEDDVELIKEIKEWT